MLMPAQKNVQILSNALFVYIDNCLCYVEARFLSATPVVVRNSDEYTHKTNSPQFFGDSPNAFLVVVTSRKTDPTMWNDVRMGECIKAPNNTVRSIPWLAFQQLRGSTRDVNT